MGWLGGDTNSNYSISHEYQFAQQFLSIESMISSAVNSRFLYAAILVAIIARQFLGNHESPYMSFEL